MIRKRVLPTGIAMAFVASAGALVLTAGPASAAPVCKETDPGKSCVAIDYRTSKVKSIRINGRCQWGTSGYYSETRISATGTPDVLTYGGAKCEGGTRNTAYMYWKGEDSDGYRWVAVLDEPSDWECGPWPSAAAAARPNC